MPPKNKKTPRIPGRFHAIDDLDEIEDDDVLPSPLPGKRAAALRRAGKPPPTAAEPVGSSSKEGRRESSSSSAHPQISMPGRLRIPPPFWGTTRRTGFGPSLIPAGSDVPPKEASGQDSGLHLASTPWQTSTRSQAPPGFALPSAPTRGNPASRDVPPTPDLLPSASRTSRGSRLGLDWPPPVSTVPPPDASASETPREGGAGEVTGEAGKISTNSDSTLTRGHEDITDETSTQTPMLTPNAVGPSSATKSTRKYRFQDEIDPDLLASGSKTRKPRPWLDLNAPPRSLPPSPGEAIGSDSLSSTAWGRKKLITQAEQAATPTPAQRLKQSNTTGIPPHELVSVNKRLRTRSSSSPSLVPDTPPHKRQQQEYRRKLHAIAFAPRSPEDGIEDADTLLERLKPSQKRQKSDVSSSPTKSTSPVRKRQRILIGPEDTIEDGPDSPLPSPRGIDGVSLSGDEVAEPTDDIDHAVGIGALLEPPSEPQAPTCTTQSTGLRPLLDPDAMRRYFKATKPVPKYPSLDAGMINILNYFERITLPEDPTPPPASPPRRAYVENGLAETAMWWKHDAQERHKRMFTEDKPTLTCRVLIREFLRDDKMCFIKGPGENKDGKEGDVRVVVTDRAAEAVTRKGVTLLYEGPWFEINLLDEEEPYRFLIGNWRIEQTTPQKGKGKGKMNETEVMSDIS